jgi:multisubunit Na+/H+ antiporter MnhE subunit
MKRLHIFYVFLVFLFVATQICPQPFPLFGFPIAWIFAYMPWLIGNREDDEVCISGLLYSLTLGTASLRVIYEFCSNESLSISAVAPYNFGMMLGFVIISTCTGISYWRDLVKLGK